jgi:UDP:flavonoid glycosyltransferase YjiC (YdhE family)
MAAVVHHGGAGTTAAGLRAGVPSIIIPFMGDQPFWGRRVAELGVGPQPIARKKLTAERLAEAINQALSGDLVSDSMRRKADRLGQKIRNEDGLTNAVALIDGLGKPLSSRTRGVEIPSLP